MTCVPSSLLIPAVFAATLVTPIALDVDRAQLAREEKVTGYTVTETYKLRNSRFTAPAGMVVKVTYEKGTGKTYRVLSRTGPSFLQSHVLDRMLREETDMSHGQERTNALITSANYQMKLLSDQNVNGVPCQLLELTPRRKDAHLLNGRAWVNAVSHNLVRIEGKPAASVSFLAGTPTVTRDYKDIAGFSFATHSHAVSQSFFLGHSELTIDYTDYDLRSSGDGPRK